VNLLKDVKGVPGVYSLQIMPMREVPWFPQNIRDLDLTVDTLDGGTALINEDHPGFSDKEYRSRRDKIIENAKVYRHGDQIPRVEYSDKELLTWQAVYKKLQRFRAKWACAEYQSMMPSLEKYCGYSSNNIPQLQDISDYLQQRTGFTLRPISGLLSARDFLNMLAFRVFSSTQYIRHDGNPFYTPEPDICHELLGHIPMFADPAFADFSQEIGLASLAASEDDILRLSSVYWFTVEFGLVRGPGGAPKAYGAGLLSSFGEMEWACSENPSRECAKMGSMENMDLPTILPFDAYDAGRRKFPITTYQPAYYCVDSIGGLKQQTKHFCDSLARPFSAQYDELTQNIIVGKSITLAPRVSTADAQAASQSDYFDN
jgi:phenylalanine-4-hydroxylase